MILPLSHKLGYLILYGSVTLSNLFFGVFFLFFGVFLVECILFYFILQLVLEPCGRTAAKQSVDPNMAASLPFPREESARDKMLGK